MSARISIEGFYDPVTGTISYVVACLASGRAAIVDPVLDYDFKSGRVHTASAERVLAYVAARGLHVDWLLETHAHADHLSAAHFLRARLGGKIAIGANIRAVQSIFRPVFNLGPDFVADGSQFDHLFQDGETFRIGEVEACALPVPGHTPADLAYRVEDAVFVGDTLFMPDLGTARADFPGGDAPTLFRSIRSLLALPEATRLFVCHDYPPATRAPCWESTVAEQRAANIHVRDGIAAHQFVAMRGSRDATLDMPTLILPSLQVNLRAGALPEAEENGVRYLKIPLNAMPG